METSLNLAKKKFRITDHILEIILIGLVIVFAFIAPNFFTVGNMLNILRNISFKGIIAMGMTMVIISGEIDLSIGSKVALSGVINAMIMTNLISAGMNSVLAFIISFTVTLAIGFVLGMGVASVITRFGVPSFIVTLAAMALYRGTALILTNGFPITGFPSWFSFIGSGYIGRIPFPPFVFVAIMLVMFHVMSNTPFGRSIYAVGSNKEAAKLSGINVNYVKMIIFAVTTTFAALSGVMTSAQVISGNPTLGQSWEFDVISAVIIGGTSLYGGSGTVRGTLIGCVFLGILLNAMTLMNVSDYWQFVLRGGLILVAVLINTQFKGRARA